MTTLKITLTKEIYERAMYCGTAERTSGCAISLAVRDIFPDAHTVYGYIMPFGVGFGNNIPHDQEMFIHKFDSLSPDQRLLLPEFSFTVELPDEVVERIDISDIDKSLTLELV